MKVTFQAETRLLSLASVTFDSLAAACRATFPELPAGPVRFAYRDADGDQITARTTEELTLAASHQRKATLTLDLIAAPTASAARPSAPLAAPPLPSLASAPSAAAPPNLAALVPNILAAGSSIALGAVNASRSLHNAGVAEGLK